MGRMPQFSIQTSFDENSIRICCDQYSSVLNQRLTRVVQTTCMSIVPEKLPLEHGDSCTHEEFYQGGMMHSGRYAGLTCIWSRGSCLLSFSYTCFTLPPQQPGQRSQYSNYYTGSTVRVSYPGMGKSSYSMGIGSFLVGKLAGALG